jgi:hypothetical protein
MKEATKISSKCRSIFTRNSNFCSTDTNEFYVQPLPEIGLTNPGIGLTNPGIGLTNPGIGLTNPGIGLTNPGIGLTNPNLGSTNTALGSANPDLGSTNPDLGLSNPDLGLTNLGLTHKPLIVITLAQRESDNINRPNYNDNQVPWSI